MPGLGPSLLSKFLAEGITGTQLEPGLTERETMVQPVGFGPPSGRPDGVAHGSRVQVSSAGKYDEFGVHLHQPIGRQLEVIEGPPIPSWSKFEDAQRQREIAATGEGFGGLAPVEETGLGPSPADPATWLFSLSPLGGEGSPLAPVTSSAPSRSFEPEALALIERWVRRLAVGGDPRRAAARLEIGAGRYAGAELIVVAELDRVSVELRLPEGAVDTGLAERLRERLEARGYGAEVRVS